MNGRAVTEAYEERLWEELILHLADAVPNGATQIEAEDAVVMALGIPLTDIYELYEPIKRLARTERGYLCDRIEKTIP